MAAGSFVLQFKYKNSKEEVFKMQIRATKIRMKQHCARSNDLLEIEDIYLTGCAKEGFYKKADIYDHLKKHPGSIKVNIAPYPDCIPAISNKGEKYVRSSPNNMENDNLLNLPRH